MRWKMECSIQSGEAKLHRTFHFLPNENIFTIARMKTIHYLFYITSKIYFCYLQPLINLYKLENSNSFFDCAVSDQRSRQCTIECCTVILHGSVERWCHTHSMVYLFHITWPCIIQSNGKNLHRCYIIFLFIFLLYDNIKQMQDLDKTHLAWLMLFTL